MRILHVSDWHLGRTTYGEPRSVDHDAVLQEIITLARNEKPDLVVHSGDLFDHIRPSVADLDKAMTVLAELGAIAPVVVVCGNHDSPPLFRFLDTFIGRRNGVRFIDQPRDPGDGGVLRFTGPDDTVLRLAVLPFVHSNRAVDAFDDVNHWRTAYAERIGRMEQALATELMRGFDPRHEMAIFAAHQYVGGAKSAGSERPVHASDYYATKAEDLPAVGYAAFGHIHKPQELPSTKVVGRYAGSPIQLDFGEEGERKSVVLVDLRPGHPANVEEIELKGGRRLRNFDGTLDELRALAPSVGRELCLVNVHTPTHQPTLSEQVRDLLPGAVLLQVNEVCADRKLEVLTRDAVSADTEPDMHEMFRDYLAEHRTTSAPADRVCDMFVTLLTAVETQQPTVLPEESLLTDPLEFNQAACCREVKP